MKGLHILFDGNNTAYRANVVSELSTKQGFRTSAIMGTLNIIHSTVQTLTKEFKLPTKEVIFVWDKGHSKRRTTLYPEYKAGRKSDPTPEEKQWYQEFYDQIEVLHQNLHLLGIKSFMKPYWEGDDILLGITEELSKNKSEDISVIVSTDEDFHQLISPNISLYTPIKKILYTFENYESLMLIKPEQFLSYKILKGDSSDNIPGIKGIGEVTAKSLVYKYGNIEGLLNHKMELMKSKRTAKIFTPEGLEILDRNDKLINLKKYVDLSEVEEDIKALLEDEPTMNSKAVREFLTKYQLVSLLMKYKDWSVLFEEVVNNFYE